MTTVAHYPWHKKALSHVELQLREDRQPHATLYRLRADYDDTALGWQIAKYLLCDTQNGCDECKHCRLVNERAHPNVLFLDVVNDKVGIDNVRELEQQMWQTSMFDKPKVAYIQGMDLLSLGAQNALLKTLEEPPKNTFFVLSVQNISRVLPTIMSRVQRLRHGKIEQETLLHWLQQQLPSPMTEAEIAKTAKLVDFSPIRALALLSNPEISQQLAREKSQFAEFVAGKCAASALASSLEKDQAATQLARYCRYTENLIHFLFGKSVDKNVNVADEAVSYPTWNGVPLRSLYRLHDALMDLRRLADTNVNLALQLTTCLADWQHERTR